MIGLTNSLVLLEDGKDFYQKTDYDQGRGHGYPCETVHNVIIEYFGVFVLAACHQDHAQGNDGTADSHPNEIFLAEQWLHHHLIAFLLHVSISISGAMITKGWVRVMNLK